MYIFAQFCTRPYFFNHKLITMKKKNLLFLPLMLCFLGTFAQFEVTKPSGSDGLQLNIPNTNGYNWSIRSEVKGNWNHSNPLNFHDNNNYILFQLLSDKHANLNGRLELMSYSRMHFVDKGTKGYANGFDFNSYTSYPGFLLETHKTSYNSGFYCDNYWFSIYSAGSANRLLRVYDSNAGMQEKWYIDGNGYARTNSDERVKENIKDVDGTLSQLLNLKAKKYNHKKDKNGNNKSGVLNDSLGEEPGVDSSFYDNSKKKYYGFLAQDVEKIFPDIVDENEEGTKFVCYEQFIPLLLEALREQNNRIENQQKEIDKLKKKKSLKDANIEDGQFYKNVLYQNAPNPFSEISKIKYFIKEDVQSAMLNVYNMSGTQLKSIPIHQKGNGFITIVGNEFVAGMYMYALIADGEIVDSKQMILTK